MNDSCWTFCTEFVDFNDLEPLDLSQAVENEISAPVMEADDYYDFEQLVLGM